MITPEQYADARIAKAIRETPKGFVLQDVVLTATTFSFPLRILAWLLWRTPICWLLRRLGGESPYSAVTFIYTPLTPAHGRVKEIDDDLSRSSSGTTPRPADGGSE